MIVSRIAHLGAERAAPTRAPWWEAVPLDLYRQDEPFALSLADRMKVAGSAATDVVLRTLGACLVGSLAFPVGYNPRRMRAAVRAADGYFRVVEGGDPNRFFRPPSAPISVDRRPSRFPLFRPGDGSAEDLRWESGFRPFDDEERGPYLAETRNRIAHVRWFRHDRGPRPTVVAIHGFSADLYHLNEWFFSLPWFYSRGCDVALFTLPFHGARASRWSPFSGYGFFAGGAPRMNEAFAQAIHDLRGFVSWLETRGATEVGLLGVSLGGFTSALAAALDDRLRFVVPNVPVVSIADLVMEWEPIGTAVRAALATQKTSLAEARKLLAVASPLTWPAVVPRARRMIVGGVGDRLAPPTHARLLWEHWDRCRLHWFPGSHLVHLDRGAYLRETGRFLREIGFLDERANAAA